MHVLALSTPTLAISLIYCLWQRYLQSRWRRQRLVCERVAYLLWELAWDGDEN